MAATSLAQPGPIRTAKTPKRVRFAGEDRDQTRLIRQQEADKRDARHIPRVDVTTSYELPVVTAAAEAIFNFMKSKAECAKSTLGSMVEFGKTALTTSFTSSFGKINIGQSGDTSHKRPAQEQQASMLEYPPFLAGATPNVVKRNRRDYYQSMGVMTSMRKAKSYAPGSTPARTPEDMQSDKEKNWYRFHETPYAGHKLDFGRGRSSTTLPPPSRPEYRFESPTRQASKRKTPRSSKSSAKKQPRSTMKKPSKPKLGEVMPRRSNVEEFHANFSGRERNELYASYTRFLTAIRFDVKAFATSLQQMILPTEIILKIYEEMKRSDWDFFMQLMADEEYWGQVKGVGSTKVPIVQNYVETQPKEGHFPCDYCRPYEWAGKVETREIENDGDAVPVKGHTKYDEPYTREEQAHIDAGRFYKVFHRFCHESRYDWKFPDPSRPCGWEGQDHPSASNGQWSISKYDPRLRHFPLYMQRAPKRGRAIQQELHDMVRTLTAQDRAAWLYIQGIRRYNTRMASLLEKMDLERKRQQVKWPCQMQLTIHIKNKPKEPEPKNTEAVEEEAVKGKNKRAHSEEIEEDLIDMNGKSSKRAKFEINKPEGARVMANGNYQQASVEDGNEKPEDDSRKRTRSEDIDTDATHNDKRAHTRKPRTRIPPGSFGLQSDDEETEDDEKTAREREREKLKSTDKASEQKQEPQQEQPKLTWLQKLDATMKQREAEWAAQEAEKAKAEAEKAATKPPTATEVPQILANKPVLPAVPTVAPSTAPKKPFVFEDPSPTQEQTAPTDDGRNPLKEHTNGVKPSSAALASSIPNLFSSAVPNLAPTGFSFGQNNDISPLKSVGPATSTLFGSGKTGIVGNEENIPTTGVTFQTQQPFQALSAPAAPLAPALASAIPPAPSASAPSLFAPKPSAAVGSNAPPPVFHFPTTSTAPAPSIGFFPVPPAAAAPAATENKPFFFGKQEESKETNAAPKAAASIFSGLPAAPAAGTSTQFLFGGKPAETVPATNTLFSKPADAAPASNLFAKSAETTNSTIFGKPAETTTTALFGKPAETATTNLFSKPAETTRPATLFGNFGGVSAAPATATATSTASTVGLFGATSAAPITAPAASNSGIFGSVPAPAPVEAPKSFVFGAAATAPKVDFAAKPAATNQFNFTTGAKQAGLGAPTQFNFLGGGAKSAETAAPTSLFSNAVTTSAPSAGTTTSTMFSSGITATSAPSMLSSFPTTNSSFVFGGPSAAPTPPLSQSFPPTTPQAQPPAMLFGGYKTQDTPSRTPPGNNKFNEDISMASPEQSPEKPSPKTGLYGNGANGMSNGLSNGNNPFNQNKPFFSTAPTAPSPLGKFNFGSTAQPSAPIPAISSFGNQPGVSMPAATGPTSAPARLDFSTFPSIPGVPAPTAAPASAPAATGTFQFDAGGLDFSLQNSPSSRKIATPRGRRGGKR